MPRVWCLDSGGDADKRDAVDANCWRAQESQPVGRVTVGNVHEPYLGVCSELAVDPLDKRDCRLVIRQPSK